tara:strand:- start:314 stop:541 length:228 start_codon:yes stop_codon:yes gene_type:complete
VLIDLLEVGKMKTILKITGMHCKSCKMLIEDALEDINVKSDVSVEREEATVEFDEAKVSLDKVKKAIEDEGYTVK